MKISTKGRYGLEAIVDLAIHSVQGPVNLKSIAERCDISEAYILQIFLILRRAGIVDSIRGAQGGYVLARPMAEITVGNVLTSLEGPLAPVACIVDGEEPVCAQFEKCSTRNFWESMMFILNDVADSVTIEDLVDTCKKTESKSVELEYYI